jgi:hypothetical protein
MCEPIRLPPLSGARSASTKLGEAGARSATGGGTPIAGTIEVWFSIPPARGPPSGLNLPFEFEQQGRAAA